MTATVPKEFRIDEPPSGFGRAFTLIELLVVVSIIALLASLLIPAISRAKASAKSAVCKNNLRQIGVALVLYADDFRTYPLDLNNMPPIINGQPSADIVTEFRTGHVKWWYQMLRPQLSGSRDPFYCPANPRFFRWTNDAAMFVGFSYGWNYFGSGAGPLGMGTFLFEKPLAAEAVRSPANMIALGDTQSDFASDAIMTPKLKLPVDGPPGWLGPSKRHQAGANMVFCDGHVEYGKHTNWVRETDLARRRWNRDDEPHRELW